MGAAPRRTGRGAVRLMLLAAVMFGVVAMHHVASVEPPDGTRMASAGTVSSPARMAAAGTVSSPAAWSSGAGQGTAPSASHSEQDPATHHLVHLCLAVVAGAVLMLGALLLRVPPTRLLPGRAADWFQQVAPWHPPPRRGGRALLLSLCVIRV